MAQERVPLLRNFVFTWNNWSKSFECENSFIKYIKEKTEELGIQYIIFAFEVGNEKKTPHIQGYCELEKRKSFNTVKVVFHGCYLADRRGSQQDNIEYCRKTGNYHQFGTPKAQGMRTDLQGIKQQLSANSSIKALLETNTAISYQGLRMAEKLLRYTDKERHYRPQIIWICGPTGTGKTRTAVEMLPNAYFKTNCSYIWWPNYDGEEDIIIDDLRPENYPFVKMLGMTDRYPFQVEDKGLIRQFRGRRIIVTAPYSCEYIYTNETKLDITQLTRRINRTFMLNKETPEVGANITPDLWQQIRDENDLDDWIQSGGTEESYREHIIEEKKRAYEEMCEKALEPNDIEED